MTLSDRIVGTPDLAPERPCRPGLFLFSRLADDTLGTLSTMEDGMEGAMRSSFHLAIQAYALIMALALLALVGWGLYGPQP